MVRRGPPPAIQAPLLSSSAWGPGLGGAPFTPRVLGMPREGKAQQGGRCALLFAPLLGAAQGQARSFLQACGNHILQWGKKSLHCV